MGKLSFSLHEPLVAVVLPVGPTKGHQTTQSQWPPLGRALVMCLDLEELSVYSVRPLSVSFIATGSTTEAWKYLQEMSICGEHTQPAS